MISKRRKIVEFMGKGRRDVMGKKEKWKMSRTKKPKKGRRCIRERKRVYSSLKL